MELYLNEILAEKGISINQLHKITGISRTTLDPLSKEKIVPKKTRIDTLNRIAEALNINLNELISFSKVNEQEFNIKLHEVIKHDYLAYENSFMDRLLLEVSNGNKIFYAYVTASYRPLDIFLKKHEKLIEELEHLVNDYKHGEELDDRFDEISNFLNDKAMLYRGKFIFDNYFLINDFFEVEKRHTILNKIPLNNKFSSMRENLTDEYFLMSISNWLGNYYELKNQISMAYPKINSFDAAEYEKVEVDYFISYFTATTINTDIKVEYKFKIE
ncbi:MULTISPECIES: helix-turn-helix transcriptional regulator [unclassified Enterococcus]|uniref:helix-turn-helix domain-containing protein n=1 Tax=unclassified Enterococcus TaxID=2608891 RepID=UPI0015524FF5|nr:MULTISPECIES: helix-turn-helix transcriptional regulator [unclassified Enterococcus]MBS7576829.1 helix-turn-helix transcriptional regulator [Enterococcus sp. MMGLQ5-2]MBS7584236.1 helix-turn-helix transcriptional regulator [Enterococcus sp. MMGLQ5-1]NPD12092.1 helix-turn-helix transcriptional regulator [Enterococcus sp. MMGLQ5-1]NPD36664.1 helix-turn-helix transcriptional regulator [Enterococcus sp. MMGLQ5-2]